MIGQSDVASIVGKLRPAFRAIDIDLEDWRAERAVDALANWCTTAGLWHLLRPSSATGRWHVLVAVGNRLDELVALIEQLRAELRVPAKMIDLRTTLRPLSAPHRLGGWTAPSGDLTALRDAVASLPASPTRGTRPSAQPPTEAYAPRPRRRTPLPAHWASYLADGVTPPIGGQDRSRSTVEAIATGTLLRAGYDATAAWDTITTAHPAAFPKSRSRGRRWWTRHLWNRQVEQDTGPADHVVSPEVSAALNEFWARLWDIPADRPGRTSLLRVGLAIWERCRRENALTVPVPRRNLVLDTGISCQKTVSAALAALHDLAAGTLTKHEPGQDLAKWSHTFTLPSGASQRGMSSIPPPRSYTPTPAPGSWTALPPLAAPIHTLLRQGPLRAEDLAGLLHKDWTPGQARTVRRTLHQLQAHELVESLPDGTWQAVAPVQVASKSAQAHRALCVRIEAERRAYRSGAGSWSTQRRAAIRRSYLDRVAWHRRLPTTERLTGQRRCRQEFERLDAATQRELKLEWARARQSAGLDEEERRLAWIASLPEVEYRHRRVDRAATWRTRPAAQRQACVDHWAAHRAEFGLGRGHQLAIVGADDLLPTANIPTE